MKKIILLLSVMFCASMMYAQDNNNPFAEYIKTNRELTCQDVTVPCSNLFVRLMKEDKADSVEILLKYWNECCPSTRIVTEAEMIYDMTYNNGLDVTNRINLYYIIDRLDFIKRLGDMKKTGVDIPAYYKEYRAVSMKYDEYVIEKATELKEEAQPGTMKHLLSNFIANPSDSVYYEIQKDDYKGTYMQQHYLEIEDYYYSKTNFVFNVGTGIWIPTGDLKWFGVRPEVILISFGGQYRWLYCALELMAGPTRKCEPYTVHVTDSGTDVTSEKVSKSAYNLTFGFDVFKHKRNEIKMIAGLGLESMLVYSYPKDENGNQKRINAESLLLSAGIEYDIYATTWFSIGLRAKYNYTNYAKNGKIDMGGNSFNFMILFNFMNNSSTKILRQIKSHYVDY